MKIAADWRGTRPTIYDHIVLDSLTDEQRRAVERVYGPAAMDGTDYETGWRDGYEAAVEEMEDEVRHISMSMSADTAWTRRERRMK